MTIRRRFLNLLILAAIVAVALGVLLALGVLGDKGIESAELLETEKPVGMEDSDVEASVGSIAPDFELSDLDGDRQRLSDFRGRAVYINFWATWCEPCIVEMPDIYSIRDEFGDDLAVLSINRGQRTETARDFLEDVPRTDGGTGVSFDVDGLDPTDVLYERYRGLGMPVSVFVDPRGVVTEVRNGIMEKDEMRQAVNEAMGDAAPD
jgi:thiol-disulfide isomerase/thioredoxin